MDKRAIFLLIGLLAASAAMSQAYRWVDDDGVVHYSDRPTPGAERVVLPGSSNTAARRYQTTRSTPTPRATTEPVAAPFQYDSLNVATPSAEQTLWNIEGTLRVALDLEPSLRAGHQIRVYFDGGTPRVMGGTNFQIDEVYRGVHMIQAEVVDADGNLMIRSQTNRFYVQQNSIR